MPGSKSLASATKIINQHLISLQSLAGTRSGNINLLSNIAKSVIFFLGKNGSKSSLTGDSIDRPVSPQLDVHKRSKSILKKPDSGSHHHHHHHTRNNGREDPESERLISDNVSACNSDNGGGTLVLEGSISGSDYSPAKIPLLSSKSISPVMRRHRSLGTQSNKKIKPTALSINYKSDAKPKPPLFLLDDILAVTNVRVSSAQVTSDNKVKNSNEIPLYICPPPPPMETEPRHSPTEETKLLLHHSHDPGSVLKSVSVRKFNNVSSGVNVKNKNDNTS